MTNESIKSVPDPARTMEGLRDTGYEFNTAVADLVDNSIAAHATAVDIRLVADIHGNIRLSIADNGDGMNRGGLILAMQYGSPKRADPASLGKFGLGLKTASTAYCRRLSVVSRNSGSAPALMATWDLDHVAARHEWELLFTDEPDDEALEHLDAVATSHSGTAVVWTNVDRLMNYKDAAGGHARKGLQKKKNALIEHLAMVYQRFLDPKDKRAPNVSITVNGADVKAWDPFQAGYSELLASEMVKADGTKAEFVVRAYLLPRPEEFPNEEAAKTAKIATTRQGIYVYRQDRLIHDADWLGMFQIEPHLNLLRVEFSFTYELDEFFHLDIKKSQIILDDELWNWLKDQFLPAPRREANRRYREGEKKKISKATKGAHDASNRTIGTKEAEIGGAEVNVNDPNTGSVTVINPRGKFTLKLPVGSANRPGEVFVQPSSGVSDGMLFEPCIIEQHKAVRINTEHEYYRKVYIPNLKNGVTIQGMDSLLWALAVAELSATTDKTEENFSDMRFEVSRILRKLVEGLPEPELGTESDVA
jgi:hypothetical protein